MSKRMTAAVVVLGALLLGGCSSEPTAQEPSPSATLVETPTPTPPHTEDEAIAGALAATQTYYRLLSEGLVEGRDATDFSEIAAGQALEYAEGTLKNEAGLEYQSGTIGYDLIADGGSEAFELKDAPGVFGLANLYGCSDARSVEYVDAEGKAGSGVQLVSIVNAHLDLEAERWIVDQVDVRADEEGRCGG